MVREHTQYYFNFFKCVEVHCLTQTVFCLGECPIGACKASVFCCCGVCSVLQSVRSCWLIVLHRSSITLLVFFLVGKPAPLKSSTTLWICYFFSQLYRFCFMELEVLMFVVCTFRICVSSWYQSFYHCIMSLFFSRMFLVYLLFLFYFILFYFILFRERAPGAGGGRAES